jgi:integrase
VDERGLTWLQAQPKIKLLANSGKRQPYPLSWDEQHRLFRELPSHLEEMALFAVNTGCRDSEICGLRWEYEVAIPELVASVFIIPGSGVKNGDDRLVILNRIAASVVEACRGRHSAFVFPYEGHLLEPGSLSRFHPGGVQHSCH